MTTPLSPVAAVLQTKELNSALAVRSMTLRAGMLTWYARCLDSRLIAGCRWIELALSGLPNYTVVLKISIHADTDDARRALEWWLLTPGHEDGDVIEVM